MQNTEEPMAVIIAGGRDYQFTDDDIAKLNSIPVREFVGGGSWVILT